MLKIQWEEQQQSLKGNTKKFVIAIKKKKKTIQILGTNSEEREPRKISTHKDY